MVMKTAPILIQDRVNEEESRHERFWKMRTGPEKKGKVY